jgi:hypothetical protein
MPGVFSNENRIEMLNQPTGLSMERMNLADEDEDPAIFYEIIVIAEPMASHEPTCPHAWLPPETLRIALPASTWMAISSGVMRMATEHDSTKLSEIITRVDEHFSRVDKTEGEPPPWNIEPPV